MTTRTRSEMGTQGIAVFDVCGTVTRTNNTSDFIGFVLKRDSAFKYGLSLLVRALCLLGRFPGIRRVLPAGWLRNRQIALLRGYSAVRLREMAGLYVDSLFSQGLQNPRIVDAMRQERERGNAVFFVSAAVDPPIAAIAERFHVEGFFSSELETADGVCTGRLKSDLLGRKHVVLERIAVDGEGRDSSVYSDNPQDAAFMEHFARRYIVLNTIPARRMWPVDMGRFHPFANYDIPGAGEDIDSINERTAGWIYVPPLYYVISRFHRRGLYSLVLRETIPVTLAGCLFTSLGALSFVLMPLSFLMFDSIYEIGGLVNDLCARREPPDTRTRRISPQVRIHIGLFVSLRIVLVALLLIGLPVAPLAKPVYAGLLCLCLAGYLLHTASPPHRRVFTFILLKWCRCCVPWAILLFRVPIATLVWLCTIFFLLDGFWRVYVYCRMRGLIRARIPVWHTRCVPAAILCGLGAVVYLVTGFSSLLIIGSYYVLLECLQTLGVARLRDGGEHPASGVR
ncbi:MAG: haloacid dehalogenase-like hydrolase [Phycisphaerales bacterium]